MAEVVHLRLDRELLRSIDEIVTASPLFRNRSEYIRSRIREDITEDRKRLMDETALEIKEMIVKRGAKPGLITAKEKRKIADDFLKEKGFK